jgi:hypothetical protein
MNGGYHAGPNVFPGSLGNQLSDRFPSCAAKRTEELSAMQKVWP